MQLTYLSKMILMGLGISPISPSRRTSVSSGSCSTDLIPLQKASSISQVTRFRKLLVIPATLVGIACIHTVTPRYDRIRRGDFWIGKINCPFKSHRGVFLKPRKQEKLPGVRPRVAYLLKLMLKA